MNRRHFASGAVAAAAASSLSTLADGQKDKSAHTATSAEVDKAMEDAMPKGAKLQIVMLVYPQFTACKKGMWSNAVRFRYVRTVCQTK